MARDPLSEAASIISARRIRGQPPNVTQAGRERTILGAFTGRRRTLAPPGGMAGVPGLGVRIRRL